MKPRVLFVVCALILCGILAVGLWPFHAPTNQVRWLGGDNGLLFGDHGIVLSSGMFSMPSSREQASCSIEIWLEPSTIKHGRAFLAFYSPENPAPLSIHQERTALALRRGVRNQPRQTRSRVLWIPGFFRLEKPLFLTITLGSSRTAVYRDGYLLRTSQQFLANQDCTGRLIVGAFSSGDSWSGQLRGLAIYNRNLTAAQVFKHYATWTIKGEPDIAEEEGNIALYLLGERAGRVVHNNALTKAGIAEAAPGAGSGADLDIPERYGVVEGVFLETPAAGFRSSWGYLQDILINIIGLIPLGFFFRAYLAASRRASIAVIVFGAAVSLAIEMAQAYLPTRNSGMTDIITNTAGSAIGVLLHGCRSIRALSEKLIPPLSRPHFPTC